MSSKTEIKEMIYHCTSSTISQVMQGFTALHLVFFYCRLDIANLLLNNNIINVIIRNANGKTAFAVIPGYESLCSDGCDMSEIYLDLSKFHKNNCTELLLSARINNKLELEAGDTPVPVPSGAVKPFSFINGIFSWVTTATLSSLFSNAPALPPAQQSVDHLDCSPIGSSQVDCNGTVLLTAIAISKFTGERYSMPLDDSLLTIRQVKERKLNSLGRDVKMALSKCDKLYQYPESSLSNLTISKGVHQKSLSIS